MSEEHDALEKIAGQQQATLRMIERNGFVFDSIGTEPGNWQHLAFTLYSTICEIDLIARTALDLPIGVEFHGEYFTDRTPSGSSL